jgi:ribonuclease P protein component
VLFGLPSAFEHSRVGITVTRKVGGAVARNRARRVVREVFRRHHRRLSPPIDLVVNVRASLLEQPVAAVEREFLDGFARLAERLGR